MRAPERVRWGFIGAGSIALDSVGPAVRDSGSVLHAVASRDTGRAERLGARRLYPDYGDLLDDSEVDVVYTSLHNSAHAHWAVNALCAGKHVLCEKPLAMTSREVRRMIEVARRHQRILVEACWNQWHPRAHDLRHHLAAGSIGTIRKVTAEFDGLAPAPRNYRYDPDLGGGALLDVGCYTLMGTLMAFGWRVPRAVRAERIRWSAGSADSVTSAKLAFEGGGSAQIRAGLTGALTESLEIDGIDGRISLERPAYTAGATSTRLVVESADGRHSTDYPTLNPYLIMARSVARAVQGDEAAYLVPTAESLAVSVTLDMIITAVGPTL